MRPTRENRPIRTQAPPPRAAPQSDPFQRRGATLKHQQAALPVSRTLTGQKIGVPTSEGQKSGLDGTPQDTDSYRAVFDSGFALPGVVPGKHQNEAAKHDDLCRCAEARWWDLNGQDSANEHIQCTHAEKECAKPLGCHHDSVMGGDTHSQRMPSQATHPHRDVFEQALMSQKISTLITPSLPFVAMATAMLPSDTRTRRRLTHWPFNQIGNGRD